LRVEPAVIAPGGTAKVTVDVVNTGDREGDEVPQLYIHQRVSSVTRPVLALRGFQRIHLKPGEKTSVSFPIAPEDLLIFDYRMVRVIEPGMFDILVGSSSNSTQAAQIQVLSK
jgi:beta-glucosidase